MNNKLFISYCHQQLDWVRERLVPSIGRRAVVEEERVNSPLEVLGGF